MDKIKTYKEYLEKYFPNSVRCPRCKGHKIVLAQREGMLIIGTKRICPKCDGEGYINKEKQCKE